MTIYLKNLALVANFCDQWLMDTNIETTEAGETRESDNLLSTDQQKTVITSTAEILRFGATMANAKRLRGTDLSGLSDAELLSALTS